MLLQEVNKNAAKIFKSQYQELKKIKEDSTKLEEQHQYIMATASIKDSEMAQMKDEIKIVLVENEKLKEQNIM